MELHKEGSGCPSGKRGFEVYSEALAHLEEIETRSEKRGSVYTCPTCSLFHISSRQFTVWRKKGRGKSRRNLVGLS